MEYTKDSAAAKIAAIDNEMETLKSNIASMKMRIGKLSREKSDCIMMYAKESRSFDDGDLVWFEGKVWTIVAARGELEYGCPGFDDIILRVLYELRREVKPGSKTMITTEAYECDIRAIDEAVVSDAEHVGSEGSDPEAAMDEYLKCISDFNYWKDNYVHVSDYTL